MLSSLEGSRGPWKGCLVATKRPPCRLATCACSRPPWSQGQNTPVAKYICVQFLKIIPETSYTVTNEFVEIGHKHPSNVVCPQFQVSKTNKLAISDLRIICAKIVAVGLLWVKFGDNLAYLDRVIVVANGSWRVWALVGIAVEVVGPEWDAWVVLRPPIVRTAPCPCPGWPASRHVIHHSVDVDSNTRRIAPSDHGRELGLRARARLQLVRNWLVPLPPRAVGLADDCILIGWRNLHEAQDFVISTKCTKVKRAFLCSYLNSTVAHRSKKSLTLVRNVVPFPLEEMNDGGAARGEVWFPLTPHYCQPSNCQNWERGRKHFWEKVKYTSALRSGQRQPCSHHHVVRLFLYQTPDLKWRYEHNAAEPMIRAWIAMYKLLISAKFWLMSQLLMLFDIFSLHEMTTSCKPGQPHIRIPRHAHYVSSPSYPPVEITLISRIVIICDMQALLRKYMVMTRLLNFPLRRWSWFYKTWPRRSELESRWNEAKIFEILITLHCDLQTLHLNKCTNKDCLNSRLIHK